MTEIDILSQEKIKKLKSIISNQCMDVGLKNFEYACIANRMVGNKIVGFEGQGVTEAFSVLALLNSCWKILDNQEKEEIRNILNENS